MYSNSSHLVQGTSKNTPFGFWANLTAHKYIIKKAQYTKYSAFFITFSEPQSSAQTAQKEFLEVAYNLIMAGYFGIGIP